jgi:hypothetical protein
MRVAKSKEIDMEVIMQNLSPEQKRKLFEHQEREKCKRKRKYLDESAAAGMQDYYDNHNRRTKDQRKRSRPYQCPWCHFWHLSTNGRT